MAIERVIGIDFGTSTSVIKVKTYKDGKPVDDRIFADSVSFDRNTTVPTLVFETEKNDFLCGHEVKSRAVKGTLYSNFKVDLISKDTEKREKAQFLTLKFFEYLYRTYCDQKEFFNRQRQGSYDNIYTNDYIVEKTYVSYPAKWPQNIRQLMVEIAEKAGFKNVRGCDEPTAAIHTVMVQEIDMIQKNKLLLYGESAYILMIDMGAGTTDLALCRYTLDEKTKPDILATWPTADNKALFGGREIDQKLCEYALDYLRNSGIKRLDNFSSPQNLDNFKSWKEAALSPALSQNQQVGEPGFLTLYKEMLPFEFPDFPAINREVFERLIHDSIIQFTGMVRNCIDAAKKLNKGFNGAEDIDFIILTGGHSQWYFITDILLGKLFASTDEKLYLPKIKSNPDRLIRLSKPQETVALGLVYQLMNVGVKTCSANNVWVHFEIDNYKSERRKVIEFGEVLPVRKVFACEMSINQSVFRSSNLFKCVKYSGESLETAIDSYTYMTIPKGKLARFLDFVFSPLTGRTETKKFSIYFLVEVNDDQCAVIKGTVSATGNMADPVEFRC